MKCTTNPVRPRLSLYAETATDLMSSNPVSVRADAMLGEAVALLVDKGFGAAPVIDEAGRPVGVVSKSDVLVHVRERDPYLSTRDAEGVGEPETRLDAAHKRGFEVVDVDRTCVADIMTPAVFAVSPDSPAAEIVSEMLAYKVHQMFVVDAAGVLIGVISAHDVLRHLRA
jgi:CBS domain-containing protein